MILPGQKLVMLGAAALVLTSCVSLSHIHQFADSGGDVVRLYSETGFTATSYCEENFCVDPHTYLTGIPAKTAGCTCGDFKSADKTISGINTILQNYLKALSALAEKNSANVSLSALSGAASDLNSSARLGLKSEEIKVISDLSSGISSMLLTGKRRRSIRAVTATSDAQLAVVLDVQVRNMFFLQTILKQQSEETKTVFASLISKTPDPGVKFLLSIELERRIKRQTEQSQKIQKFADGLEKVKSGHHQLYEHRENLKDASFRAKLRDQAIEVKKILLDFKALGS